MRLPGPIITTHLKSSLELTSQHGLLSRVDRSSHFHNACAGLFQPVLPWLQQLGPARKGPSGH